MVNDLLDRIKSASDLIELFHDVSGTPSPSPPSKDDLESAEFFIGKHGVPNSVGVITHLLGQPGAVEKYSSLSAMRMDVHRGMSAYLISKRADQQFELQSAVSEKDDAAREYDIRAREFAANAMSNGHLEPEVLDEMKETARLKTVEVMGPLTGDKYAKLWQRNYESILNELVRDHLGFEEKDEFVQGELERRGVNIELVAPKPIEVVEDSSNVVSSALYESEIRRATGHAISTMGIIKHYHLDSTTPKKSYMEVETSAFPAELNPMRIYLNSYGVKYDGSKPYQNQVLDDRFRKANPVGTRMIFTDLKSFGRNGLQTRYAENLHGDKSYTEGVISLQSIATPNMKNPSVTVCMLWQKQAITPQQIYAHANSFREGQADLSRAKPWKGYQLRLVESDVITRVTPPIAYNGKAKRTVSFLDLEAHLRMFMQATENDRKNGAFVEVALFEAIKVAPFVDLIDSLRYEMVENLTPIDSKGSTIKAQGQISVNGVLGLQDHPRFGVSVVKTQLPHPNYDGSCHAQERVKGPKNDVYTVHAALKPSDYESTQVEQLGAVRNASDEQKYVVGKGNTA